NAKLCKPGASPDCNDQNACTDDTCDVVKGCVHTANAMAVCDDHDACTNGDTCTNGVCAGMPLDCDDKNPCTMDSCDTIVGCKHEKITECLSCKVGGKSMNCDDKDACTKDSCGKNGCQHDKISACCHTNADCNADESCQDAECVAPGEVPTSKSGCSCRAPDA